LTMISAIFVETDGAYFGLPNVDPWDVTRDTRKYSVSIARSAANIVTQTQIRIHKK